MNIDKPSGRNDMLQYTKVPGEGLDRPPGGMGEGGIHMMMTEPCWEVSQANIDRGYVPVDTREPLWTNLNDYKQVWTKPKNPENEDFTSLSEFEEKWERSVSKGFLVRPPFSIER